MEMLWAGKEAVQWHPSLQMESSLEAALGKPLQWRVAMGTRPFC